MTGLMSLVLVAGLLSIVFVAGLMSVLCLLQLVVDESGVCCRVVRV